jgi:hypothetical protein
VRFPIGEQMVRKIVHGFDGSVGKSSHQKAVSGFDISQKRKLFVCATNLFFLITTSAARWQPKWKVGSLREVYC